MTAPVHASPHPAIAFRGVSKRFGANRVLDGIDLEVARGESLVVIGGLRRRQVGHPEMRARPAAPGLGAHPG